MSRRLIASGSPFEAAYGYSRAVVAGGFVFVAGTTGYDHAAMTIPEDPAAQAEACSSPERIVRATYYVTHADYAEPVLAVCGRVLAEVRPAATLVVVAALLRPEMKVEIEVTAPLG